MNAHNYSLASKIVTPVYIKQAQEARKQREKLVQQLLEKRRLPDFGWDDISIELFLRDLALMDSNNFLSNVGVGEREGRIFSSIVTRRNFGLGHGIGRSGDIAAIQPKAAGSSLLNMLTNSLALHMLKLSGITRTKGCIVLPMATGMSLTITLLTIRASKPEARYIIWPRMDQKTSFKCILTAGYTPLIIENLTEGEELRTDIAAITTAIEKHGAESILCVLTTTSCFAPRAPDKIVEVAQICKKYKIDHVINNAYGVQVSKCTHLINEACRVGTVTAFVQSTDKNFMVPVGGGIVGSPDASFVEKLSKMYPGRASSSPLIDLLITFLAMGCSGWKQLLKDRKDNFDYFQRGLIQLATEQGEKLLDTKNNKISLALSCNSLGDDPTRLGAMLFIRNCSGMRFVAPAAKKEIEGYSFTGYGSHTNNYPVAYMSMACPVGVTKEQIDLFLKRVGKTITQFKNKKVASN